MTEPKRPTGDDPQFDSSATPALFTGDRRPPPDAPLWAWIAFTEHKRALGPTRRPHRLGEYFCSTDIGLSPEVYADEPRWCSAFMCWAVEESGIASPRSVAGRSWLRWGQPLMVPRYGAPAVYWTDDPVGLSARCGFWVAATRDHDYCIGGDRKSAAPTIARYQRSKLLGYRWVQ